MEDLLKWLESQAEACKARMDKHERIVDEERAKIAADEDCDRYRLAGSAQALRREGDAYEVWITVLHEATRRAQVGGV